MRLCLQINPWTEFYDFRIWSVCKNISIGNSMICSDIGINTTSDILK